MNKNRFKVLSTEQTKVVPMTKEIRKNMDLKKLETRRDEIIGFNKEIEVQLNQVMEANRKLQEDYVKLIEQAKTNNGALSEINQWIESLKKNDTDNVVDIKTDKKDKKNK